MIKPIQFTRIFFYNLKNCRQLVRTMPLIFLLCLANGTDLGAEITWHENETEFSYKINHLSFFVYSPETYHNDYNNIFTSASYGTAAETPLISEFENPLQPGSGIQIQGQAMGHEDGTGPQNEDDPPYSMKARAYLSTVAGGLNDQQGADIDLGAVSRVIHRLEVDQQENYRVRVELTGLAEFDGFYVNEQYRAFYAIRTEVLLQQIVGSGDQMVIQTLPGFPVELDESNRTATVAVELRPFDDQLRKITYRIKTELELVSRIDNFSLQTGVAGNLNGNYQVGSDQAPFILEALLKPGISHNSAAINLLLLSD